MKSLLFVVMAWSLATVAAETGSSTVKAKESAAAFQKPNRETLRKQLSPEQFRVTQDEGTESPFKNEYWNNFRAGIYVDVVSGQALFSSTDKYDAGCGWPSFTKPIEDGIINEKEDHKLTSPRTEIRSKQADSHLGHVFDDGPGPTGKRYCLNSAAMKFIPVEEMEAKGYGRFLKLFPPKK